MEREKNELHVSVVLYFINPHLQATNKWVKKNFQQFSEAPKVFRVRSSLFSY